MRLLKKEIELIKKNVYSIFGNSVIYLFGSRVDDTKKGGDIDLYIIPDKKDNLFQKKIKIKFMLEDTLYKPVDIIVAKDKNKEIEKEALKGMVL